MATTIPPRKLFALPKVLYAKLEAMHHDPRDVVLTAAETLDEMNDGEVVGIYELQDTRTVHVSRKLE
jgi:hypothetical protein